MTTNPLLVIAIIALLFLPTGIFLGWQFRKLIDRIEWLEQELGKRKLPGKVMDGLEDALAILHDVHWRGAETDKVFNSLTVFVQELAATRAYQDSRVTNALDLLKILRTDHGKYDSDALNQKRTV